MKEKLKHILNLLNPFNLNSTIDDMLCIIGTLEHRINHIERNIDMNVKSIKKDIDFYKSMIETIGDTIPDMMWLKDLNGVYHYANTSIKEKLLLDDNPIGKNDIQLATAAKLKYGCENHTFGEVCGNSDIVIINYLKPQRFLESGKVKGKTIYLEVYKAPFYVDGKLMGVCGTGRDMTEYVTTYREHNCGSCHYMNDIFKKYEFGVEDVR